MILILFSSCRKENIVTSNPTVKLQFSTDTVFFDTVFTSSGSTSRKLKVYNPNKNAVKISEVKLAGGNNSSYQININGQPVNVSNNIILAGKDSLNIFVKIFINPGSENLPFIVSDSLQFVTNSNKQSVQLRAYGQNAHFYNREILSGNTIWTNEKPYVVYNSLLISKDSKLTIQKGVKVFFHHGSEMLIAGTLQCEGEVSEPVDFSGDRLENIYDDEPGQWDGIHFLQTSTNNILNFTNIKNALAGVRVDSLSNNSNPKLVVNSSVIKNMQVAGLIMYNADVSVFNTLIYNCGQYLVYGALGGIYNLKHNTFAGLNFEFNRQNPAVYFADYYQANQSLQTAALSVTLTNNIIWGSNINELIIDKKGSLFYEEVQNNLIKSSTGLQQENGNILNMDPLFFDQKKGNFKLTGTSPGLNTGLNLSTDRYLKLYLAKDLNNIERIFPSDIGCYEFE